MSNDITPVVAPDLVRSVTSTSAMSRHLIRADDKQACATSVVIAASQFISGAYQCSEFGLTRIRAVYAAVVQAAVAGGFKDDDILDEYVKRNRWNRMSFELLDEVVDRAGGADAVLDILDLANFDHMSQAAQ